MNKDDLVYLGHMLDHAELAHQKVADKSRDDFDADENLRLAVVHLIQTIGEAARLVPTERRDLHPEIPWRQIVGMRHRIVHDYIDVDFDIVWLVATQELPPLVDTLHAIISKDDAP